MRNRFVDYSKMNEQCCIYFWPTTPFSTTVDYFIIHRHRLNYLHTLCQHFPCTTRSTPCIQPKMVVNKRCHRSQCHIQFFKFAMPSMHLHVQQFNLWLYTTCYFILQTTSYFHQHICKHRHLYVALYIGVCNNNLLHMRPHVICRSTIPNLWTLHIT